MANDGLIDRSREFGYGYTCIRLMENHFPDWMELLSALLSDKMKNKNAHRSFRPFACSDMRSMKGKLTTIFAVIIFATVINIVSVGSRSTEKVKDDDEKDMRLLNEADRKRLCQYRLSCYTKNGIELSEKQREKQGHLFSSKLVPPKGRKITMKSAANMAVKKVVKREAEGKMLRKQYGKDGDKVQVLANFWTELERKNKCKYRKSCYQTGVLPTFRRSALAEWLSGSGDEQQEEKDDKEEANEKQIKKKNFNNTLEQKVFCQYRRSCYETGQRKKPQNYMNFGYAMRSMKMWWTNLAAKLKKKKEIKAEDENQIAEEVDELQLKLECKYRKSCYASGELPINLRPPKKEEAETVAEKILGGKKVPTSVKELKLFCKYRKSCYMASATSTETTKIAGAEMQKTRSSEMKSANKTITTKIKEEERIPPRNNEIKNNKEVGIDHANPVVANMENKEAKAKSKKEASGAHCGVEKPMPTTKRNKADKKQEGCKAGTLPSSTAVPKVEEKPQKMTKKEMRNLRSKKSIGKKAKTTPLIIKEEIVNVEKENEEKAKKAEKPQQRRERKQKNYIPENEKQLEKQEMPEMENEENKIDEEKKMEMKTEIVSKAKDRKQKKYALANENKSDEDEDESRKVKMWTKRGGGTIDKVKCRYRKSCYRTGILPKNLAKGGAGEWLIKWPAEGAQMCLAFLVNLIGGSKKSRMDDNERSAESWVEMNEREQMLRCKYRKSCYERMNMHIGSRKQKPKIILKTKKENQKVKKKFAETIKKQIKKEEAKVKERFASKKAMPKQVDIAVKLQCKYRKSCYETGAMPKMMEKGSIILSFDRFMGQTRNRTAECNPWRISCRQALGLPIKEKAPIGPNGKKLCRKKTIEVKAVEQKTENDDSMKTE